MFVSVTRLRLRSLAYLPPLLRANARIARQVVHAPGFAGGKLLLAGPRTFWTLTAWQNDASMRTFRSSGAHAETMRHLAEWCDEASVVDWSHTGTELPDWKSAYEHMRRLGRRSRVNEPSSDHEEGRISAPGLFRLERTLKAVRPLTKASAARA